MADPRFYRNHGPLTLAEILSVTGATLCQNQETTDLSFQDVQTLTAATSADISFFHNPKYLEDLKATQAGLVFLKPEAAEGLETSALLAVTPSPYRAFAVTAALFYRTLLRDQFESDAGTISPQASISPEVHIEAGAVIKAGAEIGPHTYIGANAVIGKGVKIGSHCFVDAHVTISHSLIGDRVVIAPGARIGQDGFGFFMDERGHVSVPQLGRVIIEDDVQVGANTTIDRGGLEDTIIGQGSRLDNLVQIAHGVRMGRHCVIVSQVGISGSTELGDFVIAAGQAGLTGHLKIGSKTRIAAQAGVMRDLPPESMVAGSPAVPVYQWHRQTVAISQLASKPKKESQNDEKNPK